MSVLAAAAAFAWLCAFAEAASVASVGLDEGFSGRVLDKLITKWSPPQQLKSEQRLKAVLSLDGEGNLINCRITRSSGLKALDVSACAAAKAAAPYGSPPYGMPAEVYFSFWTGGPNQQIPPEPEIHADTRNAQKAVEASQEANARAKAMAEAAAKSSGKSLTPNSAPAKNTASQAAKKDALKPKNQNPAPASPKVPATMPKATPVTAKPAKADASRAPKPEDDTPKAQEDNDARYHKYLSSVTWKLRNMMYVPVEAKPGVYHATVELKCNAQGQILSSEIVNSSGESIIDRYVLQGIKRAKTISPPPQGLGDTLRLTFTLERK